MKLSIYKIIGSLVLAFALSACAASVNTIENADAGAQKKLLNDRRVVTDGTTEDLAMPLEIRTGTTPDGSLMRIQIELMNRTNEVGRCLYLIEWMDADGMKIEVPTVWKQLNIQPAKIESVTAVAPNASARDFRISFKRND